MAISAVAQDQPADFARELAALREEVARLRAEVDALKTGATPAAPAPASNEMLQTQVAELAQVKVESSTKFPLKFFGTLHERQPQFMSTFEQHCTEHKDNLYEIAMTEMTTAGGMPMPARP